METFGGKDVGYATFYLEFYQEMFNNPDLLYSSYKSQNPDYPLNFYENISLDEKYIRFSINKSFPLTNREYYVTQFWFNDDYQIDSIRQNYTITSFRNDTSKYCVSTHSSLEKSEPIDIIVPTEYDKVFSDQDSGWRFLDPNENEFN